MLNSPWSWSTKLSSFLRHTLQSILMLTVSLVLVAFLRKWYPFGWSASMACELTVRHTKCHLCTCSYACIWYFRHPFLFPLRGSNMLEWVEKWVWSAFTYSPVLYECRNWWHGPMRSFSFMSLLLAQFLAHFLLMTLWFALQLLYLAWELFGWK